MRRRSVRRRWPRVLLCCVLGAVAGACDDQRLHAAFKRQHAARVGYPNGTGRFPVRTEQIAGRPHNKIKYNDAQTKQLDWSALSRKGMAFKMSG